MIWGNTSITLLYINSARATRFGLKGVHIEGSKLWATISTDIKNCQSKKSFNYLFKKDMIELYVNENVIIIIITII